MKAIHDDNEHIDKVVMNIYREKMHVYINGIK
jgi:hypothetical protein